jgi:hypothetical protein
MPAGDRSPDRRCLLGGEKLELDGAAGRSREGCDLVVETVRSGGRALANTGETFQPGLEQAYSPVVAVRHGRVVSLHVTPFLTVT